MVGDTINAHQPGDEGNGVEGRTKPTKEKRALALRSKGRHTKSNVVVVVLSNGGLWKRVLLSTKQTYEPHPY
jgi:hypothetical protein